MEPDGPDIDPSGRPRREGEKEIHPEHSQIKSIILEVPVREAYACCCRIAEWPRFIKSLHDVQCIDDNHFLLTSFVGNEARRTVLQIILRVPERRPVWQAISGVRPKTIAGPLHFQYCGHGDPKYLNQLIKDVLTWPHLDVGSLSNELANLVCFRLEEAAVSDESLAFLSPREFARVHLSAPTIILALPLIWAYWAIVGGWAEPHYLRSFGLMPAGAVVVYTPKDAVEQAICYLLFSKAYHFASKPLPEIA